MEMLRSLRRINATRRCLVPRRTAMSTWLDPTSEEMLVHSRTSNSATALLSKPALHGGLCSGDVLVFVFHQRVLVGQWRDWCSSEVVLTATESCWASQASS